MHQKKIPRVKNILHSIPILRKKVYSKKNSSSLSSFLNNRSIVIKNKHLRYVSSSIPLACIVALLLLSICIISPDGSNSSVYAEENTSSSSGEAVGGTEIVNPTAELTVEGDLTQTTLAGLGSGPVYRSHNVSINVNDVTDYTLRVSYANNSNNALEYYGADGNNITTGGTTIGGVGNAVKSSSMPENSWGFGWSDNKDTGDSELDYYTMPNYGSNNTGIAGGVLVSNSNSEGISNTAEGKLVFAANFKNDAVAGHYKTKVLLSLAATPKKVTTTGFGGITNMQDMTASICNAAEVGSIEEALIDTRDNSTYSIAKLEDNRCWMTQNLKLDISKANSLDSNNTDIAIGTTWPSKDLAASGFSNSGTEPVWNDGTGVTNSDQWKSQYGYYYNWCAATAGTCTSAENNTNAKVSGSICPRGWSLPTKPEYDTLVSKKSGSWNSGWTLAGGFFPAAGQVNSGSLRSVGSYGYYWSSTASDNGYAYRLGFDSGNVNANHYYYYDGYSVRCVAQTEQDEKDATFLPTLTNMQDMTNSICSNAVIGAQKTLVDSRDNNTYTIQKLDDGRCWMTQNLKLDLSKVQLTSANSNISVGTAHKWNNGSSTSLAPSNDFVKGTNPIAKWNNGTTVSISDLSGGPYDSRYGYYYNWCAATAESCVDTGTANQSICPRNWRLPENREYDNLLRKGYGDKTTTSINKGLIIGGAFFSAAGSILGNVLFGAGLGGHYWTNEAGGDEGAYYLVFSDSSVTVNSKSNARYEGLSVRCIAQ